MGNQNNTYYAPVYTIDGSGYIGGWGAVIADQEEFIEKVISTGRLILLNAIVAPKEPMFMYYEPVDVEIAKEILRKATNIESYIGHESTAQLLTQLSGRAISFNRAQYMPRRNDIALIVRLNMRPSGDVKELSVGMLEFGVLWYL